MVPTIIKNIEDKKQDKNINNIFVFFILIKI